MARVVFSITAAQVSALLSAVKGDTRYHDYGATEGIAAKGWLKERPRHKGDFGYYYKRKYSLTKAGRAVLAVVRELKLDKIPAKVEGAQP